MARPGRLSGLWRQRRMPGWWDCDPDPGLVCEVKYPSYSTSRRLSFYAEHIGRMRFLCAVPLDSNSP